MINRAEGCSTGGNNSSPSGGREPTVRSSLLDLESFIRPKSSKLKHRENRLAETRIISKTVPGVWPPKRLPVALPNPQQARANARDNARLQPLMHSSDITLPTPAQNLAFDELLLESAETGPPEREFLRLWEPAAPMVVVGRSSHVEQEVDLDFCNANDIPVLRRSSGGAAIVTGPGCLMYAVVLSFARRPALKDISKAHSFVLRQLISTLGPLVAAQGRVTCAGTSDLAIEQGAGSEEREAGGEVESAKCGVASSTQAARSLLPAPCSCPLRKFSGNSLRVKRTHLLYHGTLLYEFDLALIGRCLRTAPRQPEYRHSRHHDDFVANAPITRDALVEAVVAAFPDVSSLSDAEISLERIDKLVADRFGNRAWNHEFG